MEQTEFGKLSDGRAVEAVVLKNGGGLTAEVLTYGCRIARLLVPGRDGRAENVVLGHDTAAEYEKPSDVLGAAVGRYANRIGGGEFRIGGKTYRLAKNDGNNTLHSAAAGFQHRLWSVKEAVGGDVPSVTFSLESPDGDGGFPGNLTVEITYSLTADNALKIEYRARADAETPLNLTNHSYFNLTGGEENDILGEELQIFADGITEADESLIPTGKILPVEGTPYDFRAPKPIGRDIGAPDPLLRSCGGYDVNYALTADGFKKAAELCDPASGRSMEVFTDLPGVQFYSANSFAAGMLGRGGLKLLPHHALCLETQYFPDSLNRPEFPYRNLMPGVPYRSTTVYRFGIR